jgi:peptidoglycan/xylan/chitin deacetylase (PgdA/CDA1 family)
VKQIPILMYHWFREEGRDSVSRSPQLEITPRLFEQQMDWLQRRGYRSVSLERALARDTRAELPPRPVVISFDDGTRDFWQHARPILARHGFRATLFVVTGRVGGASDWDRALGEPARPLLDWAQIGELQQEGHEIGSHTASHRPLTELTDEQVREELARSRETLREKLGAAPSLLAYPRGFYASRHKRLARESGYRGACSVILGWRDLRRSDDYELKRMTIKGTESMLRFRVRVALAGRVRYEGSGFEPRPGEAGGSPRAGRPA